MSIEKYLKTQLMPNGQVAGALDVPTLLVDFAAMFALVQDIHKRLETGVLVEDAPVGGVANEGVPIETSPESKLILT